MRVSLATNRGHRKLRRSYETDQGDLGKIVEFFTYNVVISFYCEGVNQIKDLVHPRMATWPCGLTDVVGTMEVVSKDRLVKAKSRKLPRMGIFG